ncbi:hypothetical protein C8J56DRAFT_770562, partial [Mycena floridula]
HLQWVIREPTNAAQKNPANADLQIENSWLRQVLTCHDGAIRHGVFKVNMDQMQIMLMMSAGLAFEVIGSKQVPSYSLEDKCAFTLYVAVSAGGDLLLFQAIYEGKTYVSTPNKKFPGFAEAILLGFLLDPSLTETYWANFATMKQWVMLILVPYWRREMEKL